MSLREAARSTPAWPTPAEVCRQSRRALLQVMEECDALPAHLQPAIADLRSSLYAAIETLTFAIDAHELGLGTQAGAQRMADVACAHVDRQLLIATWRVAAYAASDR